MVLIGGPRQVGKTSFSLTFTNNKKQYLSWDDLEDRVAIKNHQVSSQLGLIVLDEIHKYTRWRMLLKGLYDKHKDILSIIVPGSARLDHFRKGGDSLFGRYHYHRLHPLSLGEAPKPYTSETLDRLLTFGGFPEPFISQDTKFHRRWQRERIQRVVYQDLRDLDIVKDISKMELLIDALPQRVGSLLSIRGLHEDLEASPNSVSRWISVLEAIYYCYRISPMGAPKIRAIKHASKVYLWDWSEVPNPGPRFENLVASHLLKYCHFIEDTEGHRMELRYLKDTSHREIDFVVLKDRKPLFAVECKTGERELSPSIKYFRERTKIPLFYQVHMGKKDFGTNETGRVLPFTSFCKELGLP